MTVSAAAERDLVDAVTAFVWHEAELLDERRLTDWLALFDDPCTYHVPYRLPHEGPPQVSIIRDDRVRLAERVDRLLSGKAPAQSPPSTLSHHVSQVRVVGREPLEVRSKQLVVEVHHERQTVWSADTAYVLRPDGESFKIVSKVVALLNRSQPIGDISFIL